MPTLPRSFYERKTDDVARELLGCRLVHRVPGIGARRSERLAGIIVETEAYLGAEDRACHSFGYRRTPRTESLYQEGGRSYVYFVYGMHWCFNAVTRSCEHPEAVLIRALRPTEGLSRMRRNRALAKSLVSDRSLTNGPAKLCAALEIDGSCKRIDLCGRLLFIEPGPTSPVASDICSAPRIGVDYARECAAWPLRFFLCDDPFVSKAPRKR